MSVPESPAGLLRRAAALIRERLAELPPSPWRAEGRDVTATQDYRDDGAWDWDAGYVVASCPRQDEAGHVASWGPPAALAVARWLEAAAEAYDQFPGSMPGHSLEVARAYLGETPEHRATGGHDSSEEESDG